MARVAGCWANVLDDCHGKLTREHLISVTATPHEDPSATRKEKERVLVRHHSHGGRRSWDREITVASLTSKVLCKGHNERLSELDRAGGNFCEATRAIFNLARDRQFMRLRWAMKSLEVNGPLAERWLLKTAVDIAVASQDGRRIGSATAGPNQPTVELAEMIYGLRPITEPYGLWLITLPGLKTQPQDGITVYEWGIGQNEITAGTLFSLYGFRSYSRWTIRIPRGLLSCAI